MDISEDFEYSRRPAADVEDQWALGGTVSASKLSETSEGLEHERPKQSLQIIPKAQEKCDRPCLKATMCEILCFFRVYTTTICKSQMLTLGEDDINRFFWYRVGNLICSSMPHVFVQVFLAAYVPDAHFYLDKMNPMTCGYNITVIIAALFELVLFINSNVLLMDYFWQGLFKKNPWKRCYTPMMFQEDGEEYVAQCYNLHQFSEKVKKYDAENRTLYFFKRAYYYENGTHSREYFQLSHLVHFWQRISEKNRSREATIFLLYFFLISFIAILHYNQLFKKSIWKVLKYSHYAELVITCLICIYIYIIDKTIYKVSPKSIIKIKNVSKRCLDPWYDPQPGKDKKNPSNWPWSQMFVYLFILQFSIVEVDVDYLAIVLNAPPVAQILISRSTKDHSKIEYESISTMLVFSNWIYGFLTAVTSNSIKFHCEALLGVTLHPSDLNAAFFFYLYPIFFSRFFIGNIWFAVIVLAKLVTDFNAFIITHHCLVEAIVCEWKYATRVLVNIGLTLAGMLIYMFVDFEHQMILYMYCKVVTIFIEVLGIYCLYPVDRLIEDMTFHRGTPPNSLRIWCLRFVSPYVLIKLYSIVDQMNKLFTSEEAKWFWLIPSAPITLGLIWKILTLRLVQKKPWSWLLVPVANWGPANDVTRYCRKIYKSDEYIGSQANRVLSRYMLSKIESEVVRLDIRYELHRRSTAVLVRYEDEKKNV